MDELKDELLEELDQAFDSSLPIAPDRLRMAMALLGCASYVEFAEACGISESTVRNWVKGRTVISPTMLAEVQRQTGVPRQFLTKLDPVPRVGIVNFRSASRNLERERRYLIAWASILAEFRRMVLGTRQPKLDTTSSTHANPIVAAVHTRRNFGIVDNQPVQDVLEFVEELGILAVYGPSSTSEIDAFSGWADGHPFVVLNPFKGSYLRQRFDVAHELGHIMMHKSSEAPTRSKEAEAHAFAGALLYPPTNANIRRLSNAIKLDDSLEGLLNIQEEWKVSAHALIEVGARHIRQAGPAVSMKRQLLAETANTGLGPSSDLAPEQARTLADAAEALEAQAARPITSLALELGIASRDVNIMISRDAETARRLSVEMAKPGTS